MGRGVGSSGGGGSHGGFSSHSHSGGGRHSSSHSSYSSSGGHSSSSGYSSHGRGSSWRSSSSYGTRSWRSSSGSGFRDGLNGFGVLGAGALAGGTMVLNHGFFWYIGRILLLIFAFGGLTTFPVALFSGQFSKAEDLLFYAGASVFCLWIFLRQPLKVYQAIKFKGKELDKQDGSVKALGTLNKIGKWTSGALIAGAFAAMFLTGSDWAPKSTVDRTKLDEKLCSPVSGDLWEDDWGTWLNEDLPLLREEMKLFFMQTGVQPYLWITGEEIGRTVSTSEQLEEVVRSKYEELFEDRGHLIVAFREYPDSSGNYISSCYAGADAEMVMDAEAREILLDCIDHYYEDEELSDTQVFAKSFAYTRKSIMKLSVSNTQTTLISLVVVALILAAGAISTLRTHRKKLEKERQTQRTAEVQTEFEQQKMQKQMEEDTISVVCPGCGATVQIRKGTTGTCEYCRRAITVDMDGAVKVD